MEFPFAKKSLGQNFLTSGKALSDIISAAQVEKGDEVLEIGPGRGVLTAELLKKGAHVIAIEKDTVLAGLLQELFKKEIAEGQLSVIEADILDFDISKYEHYKLIANIPYYITGQIFRMFLEGATVPPISITLLVQKEVAERVVARDGKESILSMSVKAYGEPRYVATVKRGSFTPSPNVDSAILHIGNISKRIPDEKRFFEVLKAAFAHKRKIVSKNLKEKGIDLPEGIDPKARAEDLTLEDFIKIARY